MPRPPRYTAEAMLDAALALYGEGGAPAVTSSGVARRLGAPSGSVYHRFAGRDALAAALWNRTVATFQAGFLRALARSDPREAWRGAARHVLTWSEAHPAQARLLLDGPTALVPGPWPPEAAARRDADREALLRALRELARRLDAPMPRVAFALVDVPYAAVRRNLEHPNRAWKALALEAVEGLLGTGAPGRT